MKIGICAPSTPFTREDADRVTALASASHPDVELLFDPQCYTENGHFAGTDRERLTAFVDHANDPGVDAIWFVRGGYGACRIAESAVAGLKDTARRNIWATVIRAMCSVAFIATDFRTSRTAQCPQISGARAVTQQSIARSTGLHIVTRNRWSHIFKPENAMRRSI